MTDISKARKGKGKGKKIREKIVYHVNAGHINDHLTPQHAAAQGHQDVMEADCGKAIEPALNNVSRDFRLSEPIAEGHAAYSTGDHGVGAGRSREIAMGHPDMRQGSTSVTPWTALRLRNQDRPDAEIVFGRGRVAIQQLDPGDADGPRLAGMASGNPAMHTGVPHSARNSATPPTWGPANDSLGPQQATSHAVKGMSPLEIMRSTQKIIG